VILDDHRHIYQMLSDGEIEEAKPILKKHVLEIKSLIDACVLGK